MSEIFNREDDLLNTLIEDHAYNHKIILQMLNVLIFYLLHKLNLLNDLLFHNILLVEQFFQNFL